MTDKDDATGLEDEYYTEEAEEDDLDWMDDTDTEVPQPRDVSIYKYQVEADVPVSQRDQLDQYRPFYGRHVALGNSERKDNIRILDQYDITSMLDMCPTLRHRATTLKGRVLSELQMFRSNAGFERRMQATVIKQNKMNISDDRLDEQEGKKKKRFGLFRRK